jgi:hypothetical protein
VDEQGGVERLGEARVDHADGKAGRGGKFSASASASGTMVPRAQSWTSAPGRRTSAWPSGMSAGCALTALPAAAPRG